MTDIAATRFVEPPMTPALRNYWGRRLPGSLQRKRIDPAETPPAPPVRRETIVPSSPPDEPIAEMEAPPINITWEPEAARPRITEILDACARFAGVSLGEIRSQRRRRYVVRPRQAAMYLAAKHSGRSLPEIGRRFGGKDHSTVHHARERVKADLDAGGEVFGAIVGHVERELGLI